MIWRVKLTLHSARHCIPELSSPFTARIPEMPFSFGCLHKGKSRLEEDAVHIPPPHEAPGSDKTALRRLPTHSVILTLCPVTQWRGTASAQTPNAPFIDWTQCTLIKNVINEPAGEGIRAYSFIQWMWGAARCCRCRGQLWTCGSCPQGAHVLPWETTNKQINKYISQQTNIMSTSGKWHERKEGSWLKTGWELVRGEEKTGYVMNLFHHGFS
jgi:hypothetical protein